MAPEKVIKYVPYVEQKIVGVPYYQHHQQKKIVHHPVPVAVIKHHPVNPVQIVNHQLPAIKTHHKSTYEKTHERHEVTSGGHSFTEGGDDGNGHVGVKKFIVPKRRSDENDDRGWAK